MFVHPVVQQKAQHGGRDAGGDNFKPQMDHRPAEMGGQAGVPAIVPAEGPQLAEIEHHNRQNGAQLDHHPEHLHEIIAELEVQHLFRQNHVTGAGNGQPLGNALNDAVDNGFEDFDKKIHSSSPL